MKIDLSFKDMSVNFKNGGKNEVSDDPFDLNLGVKEIKMGGNEAPQFRSWSLCTPGCGKTGTGNSFCC